MHPAVSDLVRETNAAMIELVKDPTDIRTRRRLDDVRARFEDAAAIFGHAMFEWEEESRRVQSLAMRERDERAAQLVAVRDGFDQPSRNEFARPARRHAERICEPADRRSRAILPASSPPPEMNLRANSHRQPRSPAGCRTCGSRRIENLRAPKTSSLI